MPLDDVKWVANDLNARRTEYLKYQDYHRGLHPILFGSPVWEAFFKHLISEFSDNLMPAVVSAVLDRCKIIGWDEGDSAGTASGDTSSIFDDLWLAVQGNLKSKQVHKIALRDGDAYALVWPEQDPRLWPHLPNHMTARYEDGDPETIEIAGKMWTVDAEKGIERLNVYYPDRVERWVTDEHTTEGWAPYNEDDEGEVIGHSFGRVPVEHFPNDADPGERGTSELRDAIPLQNALNKAVVDLIIAGEGYSLPTRVVTGYEPDDYQLDDEDQEATRGEDYDPRFDRWLEFGGTETRVLQLPEANLEQLLQVNDSFRLEIARVKGIPLDYFALGTGQAPSGEALSRMRDRLTARVEDREETWTPRWRAVSEMMGGAATPVWAPAEPTDPMHEAETAKAKQEAGVSRKQALREMGYTDDQIADMDRENAENERMLGREMRRAIMADGDPEIMRQ